MVLSEVRAKFIKESGRRDLVKGNGKTDNGANYYIQSGQRILEALQPTAKTLSWYKENVAASAMSLSFDLCRAVKEVWMANSGNSRYELEKKALSWLRTNYAEPLASLDTGQPLYYATAVMGMAPGQADMTAVSLATLNDVDAIMLGNHFTYSSIVFYPPSSGAYTCSILGYFYARSLTEDTYYNYWSVMFPDVLVMAALCALEMAYRNTEGVKDYINSIQIFLSGIDKDIVEEDIVGIDEMNNASL